MTILIAVIVVFIAVFLVVFDVKKVDPRFADRIYLIYNKTGKQKEVEINNKSDVQTLKEILAGYRSREFGDPCCGCGEDASIVLVKGRRKVTLNLASDGCGTVQVNDEDSYYDLSEKNHKRMHKILGKYGYKVIE